MIAKRLLHLSTVALLLLPSPSDKAHAGLISGTIGLAMTAYTVYDVAKITGAWDRLMSHFLANPQMALEPASSEELDSLYFDPRQLDLEAPASAATDPSQSLAPAEAAEDAEEELSLFWIDPDSQLPRLDDEHRDAFVMAVSRELKTLFKRFQAQYPGNEELMTKLLFTILEAHFEIGIIHPQTKKVTNHVNCLMDLEIPFYDLPGAETSSNVRLGYCQSTFERYAHSGVEGARAAAKILLYIFLNKQGVASEQAKELIAPFE